MSDIQWFQEAYGAVTQTVRGGHGGEPAAAGLVFTPGELLTTSAPGLSMQAGWPTVDRATLPHSRSSAVSLAGWGVSRGLVKEV